MSFEKLMRGPVMPANFTRNEAYFDGKKRLDALGVTLPPEMRVLEIVVDWPRILVEALEERLTIEGFTIAGQAEANQRYWRRWQANRMDLTAPLVHTEALVQGCGYVVVGGGGPQGFARITGHSALGFTVSKDRATGVVSEAVQRFSDEESPAVVHYVPGKNYIYRKSNGRYLFEKGLDSGTQRIPVVPFVNRARLRDDMGRSEMQDVIRYTDAASRSITNLQVAVETVALPQKYMLGAAANDFKDPDGKQKTQWETYIGRILLGPKDAKVGTLQGANLQDITSVLRLYAGFVSASSGMSLMSLGIGTDANPASEGALNAVDNRHVRKAEKKQALFDDSWEDVQRIADDIEGVADKESDLLETQWRPAATMTLESVAAAASTLVTAGIIPPAVARNRIGLTPEEKRIADEAERNSAASLLRAVGS
ncbi:phage portal protein [Leucobacter sp. NPDC058333]|uniref:phage portal protein n=1 Tax=Leucobacter sp. NPDC058333 TaxID=3346450 RepID=UPI0036650399